MESASELVLGQSSVWRFNAGLPVLIIIFMGSENLGYLFMGISEMKQRKTTYVHFFLMVMATLLLAACRGEDVLKNDTDPQWIYRQEPNAKVAVVFVHGIFGDTIATWSNGEANFFELLKDENPGIDIFAFGYRSKMFEGGSLAIDEAANLLYARLENEEVMTYPTILFVNHSMGGLVVMRMLVQRQDVREKVPEMVLFGTPTEGSQITTIAHKLLNNPALVDMLPAEKNTFLRALDDDFKALSDKPRVWCGYEKHQTNGVLIVPWSSASRVCDSSLAIAANHLDIVKPDRIQHDSFMVVQRALRRLLEPCRHESHGIQGYENSVVVSRTSHWMGGGYNQDRWCSDALSALMVEYPAGKLSKVSSSEDRQNTCSPLNCPQYKYTCDVLVETGAIYNERASNVCARASH